MQLFVSELGGRQSCIVLEVFAEETLVGKVQFRAYFLHCEVGAA